VTTSHRCEGCGATLSSVDELHKQPGTATRTWLCAYCRTPVPGVVAERLSHQRDGSPTDRRP